MTGKRCYTCDETGHLASRCPHRNRDKKRGCRRCLSTSHILTDCTAQRDPSRPCEVCKKTGHVTEVCRRNPFTDAPGRGPSSPDRLRSHERAMYAPSLGERQYPDWTDDCDEDEEPYSTFMMTVEDKSCVSQCELSDCDNQSHGSSADTSMPELMASSSASSSVFSGPRERHGRPVSVVRNDEPCLSQDGSECGDVDKADGRSATTPGDQKTDTDVPEDPTSENPDSFDHAHTQCSDTDVTLELSGGGSLFGNHDLVDNIHAVDNSYQMRVSRSHEDTIEIKLEGEYKGCTVGYHSLATGNRLDICDIASAGHDFMREGPCYLIATEEGAVYQFDKMGDAYVRDAAIDDPSVFSTTNDLTTKTAIGKEDARTHPSDYKHVVASGHVSRASQSNQPVPSPASNPSASMVSRAMGTAAELRDAARDSARRDGIDRRAMGAGGQSRRLKVPRQGIKPLKAPSASRIVNAPTKRSGKGRVLSVLETGKEDESDDDVTYEAYDAMVGIHVNEDMTDMTYELDRQGVDSMKPLDMQKDQVSAHRLTRQAGEVRHPPPGLADKSMSTSTTPKEAGVDCAATSSAGEESGVNDSVKSGVSAVFCDKECEPDKQRIWTVRECDPSPHEDRRHPPPLPKNDESVREAKLAQRALVQAGLSEDDDAEVRRWVISRDAQGNKDLRVIYDDGCVATVRLLAEKELVNEDSVRLTREGVEPSPIGGDEELLARRSDAEDEVMDTMLADRVGSDARATYDGWVTGNLTVLSDKRRKMWRDGISMHDPEYLSLCDRYNKHDDVILAIIRSEAVYYHAVDLWNNGLTQAGCVSTAVSAGISVHECEG
jgi:hypothetical protein